MVQLQAERGTQNRPSGSRPLFRESDRHLREAVEMQAVVSTGTHEETGSAKARDGSGHRHPRCRHHSGEIVVAQLGVKRAPARLLGDAESLRLLQQQLCYARADRRLRRCLWP